MFRSTSASPRLSLILGAGAVLAFAGAFLLHTAPSSAAATPITFSVSPSGADSSDGSADHPFRTLTKAQSAVQKVNQNMAADIKVLIADGTYRLASPLAFSAADSGTNGHKVLWQAKTGAAPIITGAQKISGWAKQSNGTWQAPAPDKITSARQLYVNGVRAIPAVVPIKGSDYTVTTDGLTTTDAAIAKVAHATTAQVVTTRAWKDQRCHVSSVSKSGSNYKVAMSQPCWRDALLQGDIWAAPTRLEGAPEWVDKAGEFAIGAGILTYQPRAGEDLTTADVELPTTEGLLTGGGNAKTPLTNVSFTGLSFTGSAWTRPDTNSGYAEGQAGVFFDQTRSDAASFYGQPTAYYVERQLATAMQPGAVDLAYAQNITFNADTFSHLGAAGVHFGLGTQSSLVQNSNFSDISGNGIELGDVVDPISHHPGNTADITLDNTISHNTIQKIGAEYQDSVGVLATYTTNSVIDHNTIHDIPYSAISVGWGWALPDKQPETGESKKHAGIYENKYLPKYSKPTVSLKNKITNNLIYNLMLVGSDGGGIYTLGAMEGTTVSGNYIHTMPINKYTHGLYLDEGSAHQVWTKNVIDRCGTFVVFNMQLPTTDESVEGNFFNTPIQPNPLAKNNTHVKGSDWPDAAQTIINNAGNK